MACLQALPDAGFYSSFLCYLWTTQSHLHRKLTACWSLNQLSTYQLARFSTWDWIGFHIYFFHLEKGTYSGLGLRLSCSVKTFQTKIGCGELSWRLKKLRRDALWDPAIHHSHTHHCHEDMLDSTTTPCLY